MSFSPSEPFSVVTWEPVDLRQALMVVGFPGIGLVGSIATAYLQRSLHLREVGSVVSSAFPPAAVVSDGVCTSPVRIFLGDVVCGQDGGCEQLCVVHSDIAPKSGAVAGLAHAIVSWAKERGARQLVCLEGFKTDGPRAEEVHVFGTVNDPGGRKFLAQLGVSSMEDGLFTGIGGVALYAARAVGLPALCLLAESRGFP